MAVPIDSDAGWYPGTNQVSASVYAAPTNDTDAIGGAIDETAGVLNPSNSNLLFDSTPANPDHADPNIVHRAIFYRRNKEGAGGVMGQPKLIQTNAMKPFSASSTVTYEAGASDAGKKVRLCGVASSAIMTPNLTTLIDGSVASSVSVDAAGNWRCELLASDGVTPAAAAEDILIKEGSTIRGMIPAGAYMATPAYEIAAATAKNTAISATNRLTDPASGIGSFARAILVTGDDSSISLGDDLASTGSGDYWGVCVRKTMKSGLQPPLLGYEQFIHNMRFAASAS